MSIPAVSATVSKESPSPRRLEGTRLGRYDVLAELASGGMATVYAARSPSSTRASRVVALKCMHPHLAQQPESVAMFLDEARLATRIRHPNVVPTFDVHEDPEHGPYLVMDYVEGQQLGNLLQELARKGKRMPERLVARLLVDALAGLAAAHALLDERGEPLNLVHRDVSPHNLLIGTDGIARLADFGVARSEGCVDVPHAGALRGKLAYIAPEIAIEGRCDARSDLFSMGIVLFETLTSRRLFRGENDAATLARLLIEPIPSPSSIDPALAHWDALLSVALARDPRERFQSADAFAEAVERVARAHEGIASPRSLGLFVRETFYAQIEREHRRITEAIARVERASDATDPRLAPAWPAEGAERTSHAELEALIARPSEPGLRRAPSLDVGAPRSELVPTSSRIVARGSSMPPELEALLSGEHDPHVRRPRVLVQPSDRHFAILALALVLVATMAGAAGYVARQDAQAAARTERFVARPDATGVDPGSR